MVLGTRGWEDFEPESDEGREGRARALRGWEAALPDLGWGLLFVEGLHQGLVWRWTQGGAAQFPPSFSWVCTFPSLYKGVGQGLQLCFLNLNGLWVSPLRFSIFSILNPRVGGTGRLRSAAL